MLEETLKAAKPADAALLWNALPRLNESQRERVRNRLAKLVKETSTRESLRRRPPTSTPPQWTPGGTPSLGGSTGLPPRCPKPFPEEDYASMSPPQGNSRCVDPELGAHPDAHAVDASDPRGQAAQPAAESWPWPRSIARWHRAAAFQSSSTSPRGPRSAGRGWGGFVRRLSSKGRTDARPPLRSADEAPRRTRYNPTMTAPTETPRHPRHPRQGRGHPAR